jgi:hypothetical protein
MADQLPAWVLQYLRSYLDDKGETGEIDVSSSNPNPVDSGKSGKGSYCLVNIIRPTIRSFEVYEDGKVVDLGCDYEGRWDGMG